MDTPGKRIAKWREHLGKSGKEFEALTGIPYSTLKTLETDPKKGKPSFDVLAKLRNTFPQLNIDWLFDEGGTEPMLRDGRTLVLVEGRQVKQAGGVEAENLAQFENVILKERITELNTEANSQSEQITKLRAMVAYLNAELGKFGGSLGAALFGKPVPGPAAGALVVA